MRAQETRRILDRLYGYEVSQLLWRKIGPKLSAGRVQSVAVKMIVERERQRIAFRSATWWDLIGRFATGDGKEFEAELVSVDGRKIPSGKDFDPATGKIKDAQLAAAERAAGPRAGRAAAARRSSASRTSKSGPTRASRPSRSPPARCSRRPTASWASARGGRWTSPRACTRTATSRTCEPTRRTWRRWRSTPPATWCAPNMAASTCPTAPRVYQLEGQERPGSPRGDPPRRPSVRAARGARRTSSSSDQFRLFELIWKRTIASQMVDARGRTMTITIEADGAVFQVSGKTIDFPGFLRAYVEGSDDPEAELADQERILPAVKVGDAVTCRELIAKDHTTQPPARFSEASLTAALEERGIGRPSTYASIIDTILDRRVRLQEGQRPGADVDGVLRVEAAGAAPAEPGRLSSSRPRWKTCSTPSAAASSSQVEYLNDFYFGKKDNRIRA